MIQQQHKPSAWKIYLYGHIRAIREGFTMPWQKSPVKTMLTVLTLSICFYVPLFLWTLWLNYEELKQQWQNQASIALFVHGNRDLKETGILLQQIKEEKIVANALLLSKNDIANQLKTDVQLGQFIALIADQDLPQQISINLQAEASLAEIDAFINAYQLNPQIEYVSYDAQWINQLKALTDTLLQLARVSALLFIAIVMVILANTIANEVANHRNELRLLELMGATWSQVRRKFLYLGVFLGVYASIIAVIFLILGLWWLDDTFRQLLSSFAIDIRLHGLNLGQIGGVMVISIMVTWLAARVTLTGQMLAHRYD